MTKNPVALSICGFIAASFCTSTATPKHLGVQLILGRFGKDEAGHYILPVKIVNSSVANYCFSKDLLENPNTDFAIIWLRAGSKVINKISGGYPVVPIPGEMKLKPGESFTVSLYVKGEIPAKYRQQKYKKPISAQAYVQFWDCDTEVTGGVYSASLAVML